MDKMLQVEKPYHIEGDYIAFIKKAPALLYRYLKVVLCELALLARRPWWLSTGWHNDYSSLVHRFCCWCICELWL